MVLCLKLRIIEYPCIYQKLGVLLGVTFSCTQMNIKRNIVFSLEKRKKDGKPVGFEGSNPSLSAGRQSQEQPKSRQVLQINDL